MVTTWPAFTEAMYLLGEAGRLAGSELLWSILQQGDLEIAFQGSDDYERMRALLQKYRRPPHGLADASLVRWLKSAECEMFLRSTSGTVRSIAFTVAKPSGYGRRSSRQSRMGSSENL